MLSQGRPAPAAKASGRSRSRARSAAAPRRVSRSACIASAAVPGRLARHRESAGSGSPGWLSSVRVTISATRKECPAASATARAMSAITSGAAEA